MSETDQVVEVREETVYDGEMRQCKVCKEILPITMFDLHPRYLTVLRTCRTCKSARHLTTRQKTARVNDVNYAAVAKGIRKVRIAPAEIKKYIPSVDETSRDRRKQRKMELASQNDMLKKMFLSAYEQLLGLGMSESDLMLLFDTSRHTIGEVKNTPEGQEAYRAAMDKLQTKLASQVLVHGLGFDYEESKSVLLPIENKETGETTYKELKREVWKRHYTGDPGLLEYFMNNKFPELWKKSSELITRKEGYDIDPADRVRKQIASLARDAMAQYSQGAEGEHSLPAGTAPIPIDGQQTGA